MCDWIPGAEMQKCLKCDEHPHSGDGPGGKSLPATDGKKNDNDSRLLNISSCSQPSTVSTMSANSAPTFVYQRRKPQRNSVAGISAQTSTNTNKSDGCLSTISSETPSVAAAEEQNIVPLVEPQNVALITPVTHPLECTRGTYAKSELLNRCSAGEKPSSLETRDNGMHKTSDFCFANDTCSSSKSNMELGSASLKTEVDDIGECSSSDAMFLEDRNDLSAKDFCISFLRSEGLLASTVQTKAPGVCMRSGGESSCTGSCKVCGQSETTVNMIICDHCEEAFHVSCCNFRIRKVPTDEWFCHSCLKKKRKISESTSNKSLNINRELGNCRNEKFSCELGPIEFMLEDPEPYQTSVRIGKDYQADVPDWSGPISNDIDTIGEPLEMNVSEVLDLHRWNSSKPSRLSSIGNWIQCREVIDGLGDSVDGTICGKWRRAPLFEVQTDNWECFRAVLWDPAHADCAVPQELDTDQVLKHLKYIEQLRPRLAAKRRKSDHAKSNLGQGQKENVTNIQTQ